jgi:hypothetical protein
MKLEQLRKSGSFKVEGLEMNTEALISKDGEILIYEDNGSGEYHFTKNIGKVEYVGRNVAEKHEENKSV